MLAPRDLVLDAIELEKRGGSSKKRNRPFSRRPYFFFAFLAFLAAFFAFFAIVPPEGVSLRRSQPVA